MYQKHDQVDLLTFVVSISSSKKFCITKYTTLLSPHQEQIKDMYMYMIFALLGLQTGEMVFVFLLIFLLSELLVRYFLLFYNINIYIIGILKFHEYSML